MGELAVTSPREMRSRVPSIKAIAVVSRQISLDQGRPFS
jgi:hypothetical protein